MARTYSKAKGKSRSTKPSKPQKPSWITHDQKTIEQLIIKYAKAGKTASHIGLILRDSYGITDVQTVLKKKMTVILKEHNLAHKLPEDLRSLIIRDIAIMKHLETNKKDMSAKRGTQLTESKIHRLALYYKRHKLLDPNWTYDRTKAKTLIG